MYAEILVSHGASFKAMYEGIGDHTAWPISLHCTFAKDRAGLVAALILSVTGVPLECITRKHALTMHRK